MDKGKIQKFAIWARVELIRLVEQRAYFYGITKEKQEDAAAVAVNG